jgi:hypothetical protein
MNINDRLYCLAINNVASFNHGGPCINKRPWIYIYILIKLEAIGSFSNETPLESHTFIITRTTVKKLVTYYRPMLAYYVSTN